MLIRLNDLSDLSAAVKAERKRRGLSQTQLAGMLGHSQKWISDLERGATDPPVGMVLRMIGLLGLRLELSAGSGGSPVLSGGSGEGMEIEIGEDGL